MANQKVIFFIILLHTVSNYCKILPYIVDGEKQTAPFSSLTILILILSCLSIRMHSINNNARKIIMAMDIL